MNRRKSGRQPLSISRIPTGSRSLSHSVCENRLVRNCYRLLFIIVTSPGVRTTGTSTQVHRTSINGSTLCIRSQSGGRGQQEPQEPIVQGLWWMMSPGHPARNRMILCRKARKPQRKEADKKPLIHRGLFRYKN